MTAAKSDIAKVCAIIASSYSTWEATRERVEVFYELLSDLDPDVLKSATQAWVLSEKWPPTVADLRSMSAEMTGALAPSAEQAWAEVTRIVRVYGWRGGKPPWSDPVIDRAVEAMGWREICVSDNIELTRAHFFRVYENYRARENRQVVISPALSAGEHRVELANVLKQVSLDHTTEPVYSSISQHSDEQGDTHD